MFLRLRDREDVEHNPDGNEVDRGGIAPAHYPECDGSQGRGKAGASGAWFVHGHNPEAPDRQESEDRRSCEGSREAGVEVQAVACREKRKEESRDSGSRKEGREEEVGWRSGPPNRRAKNNDTAD